MPTAVRGSNKPASRPRRRKGPDPAALRAALGGRHIGPHIPHKAGLTKAAERAVVIGASAVQVFADNPTAWRRRETPPKDVGAFRARLHEQDIAPTAIHGPYLINLAAADPEFRERSLASLVAELRMGASYGAFAVNFHIGSHMHQGAAAGIELIARALASAQAQVDGEADIPLIALENSAGQGDGLGSSIEELAAILEAATRAGADVRRLGFCLDTAHLWGAGFDLDDPDAIDRLLVRVDAELGPERLLMLHLNDSRAEKGSRLDRHEHIGAGRLGVVGLRHLITHPRLTSVPMYLETPGMELGYDAVNMERVRLLIAGDPLPDLPPEAFTIRSGRSMPKLKRKATATA